VGAQCLRSSRWLLARSALLNRTRRKVCHSCVSNVGETRPFRVGAVGRCHPSGERSPEAVEHRIECVS